jgi:hypothetical protein
MALMSLNARSKPCSIPLSYAPQNVAKNVPPIVGHGKSIVKWPRKAFASLSKIHQKRFFDTFEGGAQLKSKPKSSTPLFCAFRGEIEKYAIGNVEFIAML